MITAIVVLNRLDCDVETLNERFVEKVKEYLGLRIIDGLDPKRPIITTKNLVLSSAEKEEIKNFAAEEKQFVMFLEDVDIDTIDEYITLTESKRH